MRRTAFSTLIFAVLLSGCGPSKTEQQAVTDLGAAKLLLAQQKSQIDEAAKKADKAEIDRTKLKSELDAAAAKLVSTEKTLLEEQSRMVELREQIAGLMLSKDSLEKRIADLQLAEATRKEEQVKKEEAQRNRSSVTLQVGLQFQSGDSRPVANTDFYFSRVSLGTLLEKYPRIEKVKPDPYFEMAMTAKFRPVRKSDEIAAFDRIMATVAADAVIRLRTDFTGKAATTAITPGRYFLIGISTLGEAGIVWDYEVTLAAGENQIYLDQNNAKPTF